METWFQDSQKSCGSGKGGYWNLEQARTCQQLFVNVMGHNTPHNISSCILLFPNLMIATSSIIPCICVLTPTCVPILCNLPPCHHPHIFNIADLTSPFLPILLCFVSSIKSHLHVCIWHVWISISLTTIYQLEWNPIFRPINSCLHDHLWTPNYDPQTEGKTSSFALDSTLPSYLALKPWT